MLALRAPGDLDAASPAEGPIVLSTCSKQEARKWGQTLEQALVLLTREMALELRALELESLELESLVLVALAPVSLVLVLPVSKSLEL